jgi:hypothetical protein
LHCSGIRVTLLLASRPRNVMGDRSDETDLTKRTRWCLRCERPAPTGFALCDGCANAFSAFQRNSAGPLGRGAFKGVAVALLSIGLLYALGASGPAFDVIAALSITPSAIAGMVIETKRQRRMWISKTRGELPSARVES